MKIYNIPISIKRKYILPDVIDWLFKHDLKFGKDWKYTKSEYYDDWDYTFQFYDKRNASLFALRWA